MKRLVKLKKRAEIDESQFTEEQLKQLKLMKEEGFDVELINNPLFSAEQMRMIRCIKEQGISFDKFCHPNISYKMMQKLGDELVGMDYWKANSLIDGIKEMPTSDEEAIKVWENVKNKKKLHLVDTWHDVGNRDWALVYINGEFYEGLTHAKCLNEYLSNKNKRALKYDYNRPDANDVRDKLENEDVMFFAHIVEDPERTHENDLTGNKKAIYIIPDEYLLKNITIEEAAKLIKESDKYSEYGVFKDQSDEVDEEKEVRIYPRLAKLKQQLIQFLKSARFVKRLIKKSEKSYRYDELSSSSKEIALKNAQFSYDFEEEQEKIKEKIEEFFNNAGFMVFDIYFNLEENEKNYIEPEVTVENILIDLILKDKLKKSEYSTYKSENLDIIAEVFSKNGQIQVKVDVDSDNDELNDTIQSILEQEIDKFYKECSKNAIILLKSDWLEYKSEKYIQSIIEKEDYLFNEYGEIV